MTREGVILDEYRSGKVRELSQTNGLSIVEMVNKLIDSALAEVHPQE